MSRFHFYICFVVLFAAATSPLFANETIWQAQDAAGWQALEEWRIDDAFELFKNATETAARIRADDFRVGISRVGLAWCHLVKPVKPCDVITERTTSYNIASQSLGLLSNIPDSNRRVAMQVRCRHALGRAQLHLCGWELANEHLGHVYQYYRNQPSDREKLVDAMHDYALLRRGQLELLESLQLFDEASQRTQRKELRAEILLDKAKILLALGRLLFVEPLVAQSRQIDKELRQAKDARLAASKATVSDAHLETQLLLRQYSGALILSELAYLRGDLETADKLLVDFECSTYTEYRPQSDLTTDYWLLVARYDASRGRWSDTESSLHSIKTAGWHKLIVEVIELELEARKLFEAGIYGDAITKYNAAIDRCQKSLGSNHPLLTNSLLGLAQIHLIRGAPIDVIRPLCSRVIEIRTKLSHPPRQMIAIKDSPRTAAAIVHHPDIARALQILGNSHYFHSQSATGLAELEKSHKMFTLTLPDTHPENVESLIFLAHGYWAERRFDKAERMLDQAFKSLHRNSGRMALVASAHSLRGWLLLSQGKPEAALSQFERATGIWSHVAPPQKFTSFLAEDNAALGLAGAWIGMSSENQRLYDNAKTRAADLLGRRITRENIPYEFTHYALLCDKHERFREAKAFYLTAIAMYDGYGTAIAAEYSRFVREKIKDIERREHSKEASMK